LAGDFVVHPIRWDRCPSAAGDPHARAWITLQSQRGLAYNTLDAYSCSLERYFRFLEQLHSSCVVVTRAEAQCQHRMACAKCDFYMPKDSTAALLLEGRTHLLRLLQEIPLGEAEQAAVEDGVAAYENLLSKLSDVPTPAGPTPRQLGAGLVQITSVRPALPASTLTDSRSNGAGSREPD